MPTLSNSHKPAHHRPEAARQREVNRRRDPAAARFYKTAFWQKLRLAVLREQPLCSTPGCNRPARHVDHLDGDRSNNARANLDGKCTPCHSRKTVLQDGGFGRQG